MARTPVGFKRLLMRERRPALTESEHVSRCATSVAREPRSQLLGGFAGQIGPKRRAAPAFSQVGGAYACFRIAKDNEEGSERLSASDIFRRLKMYDPAAMRGSNPATFAQVLLAAGVTRKHTKYGNVYLVKPMKAA